MVGRHQVNTERSIHQVVQGSHLLKRTYTARPVPVQGYIGQSYPCWGFGSVGGCNWLPPKVTQLLQRVALGERVQLYSENERLHSRALSNELKGLGLRRIPHWS